jgi:membrane dipeptidase
MSSADRDRRVLVFVTVFSAVLLPLTALVYEARAARSDPARVHAGAVLIDGHNDVPQAMLDDGFDLAEDGRGRYDTDLDRLRQGGVSGVFFSIWVDPALRKKGQDYAPRARALIGAVRAAVERHPDRMLLATTAADVRRAKAERRLAALMGLEGAHALEGRFATLAEFHAAGVRYVTLTHTNSNEFADSSGSWRENSPARLAALRENGGLSPLGRELVVEMNRLGMLIDVSHVSDETMAQVLDASVAPVIASHSSARALADVRRNIPDDLLARIGANGGVVMVNFYSGFLDTGLRQDLEGWIQRSSKAEVEALEAHGHGAAYARALYQRLRYGTQPAARIDRVLDHIEHVAKVAGVEHVGLGSDFDGSILPPHELEDVSRFPRVTAGLMRRGWTPEAVKQVLGENTLRAMEAAERVAASARPQGRAASAHP